MNQTTNYQLSQWESTDRILMSDFNSDNSKIDAALKSQAVAIAALQTETAGFGNCKIETVTYTGNGLYGSSHPTQITFSKQPTVFFILGQSAFCMGSKLAQQAVVAKHASYGATFTNPTLTWSGNTVSFYDNNEAYGQMNHSGYTYWVFALHAEDAE